MEFNNNNNDFEISDEDEETMEQEVFKIILRIYDKISKGEIIIDNDRFDIENHLVNEHGMDARTIRNISDFDICKYIKMIYPNLSLQSSQYEIYGSLTDRKKQGWILNLPISFNSQYSNNLIMLIKESFYDFHKVDFRIFTNSKAIYIIRWLGFECKNFLNNLLLSNTDDLNDSICLGRWRFLHKFWNSKHMSFFINYENSREIIEKDHNKYLIRLSTSHSGQMALHFWNPKIKKVDAHLLNIDKFGNILLSHKLKSLTISNIDMFDIEFRELYNNIFGVSLSSINNEHNETEYNEIAIMYAGGY